MRRRLAVLVTALSLGVAGVVVTTGTASAVEHRAAVAEHPVFGCDDHPGDLNSRGTPNGQRRNVGGRCLASSP